LPDAADIQLLASIIQGEAGIMGSAGMTAVAAVFVARLLSPHYPDTVATVAESFYARAMPTQKAAEIALHALESPQALIDAVGRYFYVLSKQDVAKLKLPPGQRTLKRNLTFELHLYDHWPEERQHP